MKLALQQTVNHMILHAVALACFTIFKASSLNTPLLPITDLADGHHSVQLTSTGKQLLRREGQQANDAWEVYEDCFDDSTLSVSSDCIKERDRAKETGRAAGSNTRLAAVTPHSYRSSLVKQSDGASPPLLSGAAPNHWRVMSVGDVQAITVDGDAIYAVSADPLPLLEKGIFKQDLNMLTPYGNWTLIGYGSMTSIAIYNSPRGKIMYGVGNRSWLWNQELATMPTTNTWALASVFPLTSIAIYGDSIYGVSPDHPGELYQQTLLIQGASAIFHGWQRAGTAQAKSLSVMNGLVVAIWNNDKIYNRLLGDSTNHYADFEWSTKNETGMRSIAVWGDTIYGASPDHKVYRKPLVVNERWGLMGEGSMLSLAIDSPKGVVYGASSDGKVYKQDLAMFNAFSQWEQVGAGTVISITIQGKTLYAVGPDNKVWKQAVHHMRPDTRWQEAGACCVAQIAAADGVIYAVGPDHKVYKQADILMTPSTPWIPASKGSVFSIAIRGDTIFGVGLDNKVSEQVLTRMTIYSQWSESFLEDNVYPSKEYVSITAHNDVMYACAHDGKVYTKIIDKPIAYPNGLTTPGNTHDQAMFWNLTDLPAPPVVWVPHAPSSTSPPWEATTTQELLATTTTVGGATTTTVEGETTTTVAQVVDCYGDRKAEGCGKAARNAAWQSAHTNMAVLATMVSLSILPVVLDTA